MRGTTITAQNSMSLSTYPFVERIYAVSSLSKSKLIIHRDNSFLFFAHCDNGE